MFFHKHMLMKENYVLYLYIAYKQMTHIMVIELHVFRRISCVIKRKYSQKGANQK